MADMMWEEIQGKLKTALPPHTYTAFVENAALREMDESTIRLSFPDAFTKDGFEEKCLPILKEVLCGLSLERVEVALSIMADRVYSFRSESPSAHLPGSPFDPKYAFENFVVGTSNQFAHAACLAVAKQPGQCYNPLFIFGAAGLGKTHLLKAIGYELFRSAKSLKIILATSESFTNEVIQAIRLDRMREFREKYRNGCDVLLLDDAHFFAGRDRTQEEFFHTFNFLHECRRQIVITSDRYPRDIKGLENRLQTRFEWGLVADVQPPEIETRIAILKNKADEQGVFLPDDVAHYIASHITTNIRELEGSLHRLQAYSSLSSAPLSIDLAQSILKDIVPQRKQESTPANILSVVALHFNVKVIDLKSEKRVKTVSYPRQIAMYLMRYRLKLHLKEIGDLMGGKDHTTVMYAVTKIAGLLKTDPATEEHVAKIDGMLRS